jgi:long-chain acyl-CoA synthetase
LFLFKYDNIQSTICQLNPLKRYLFNMALSAKTNEIDKHIVTRHILWDKFVFKRIQQRLGGRVKLIVSGAAPLSPITLQFLKRVCGAYVVEGYGQTECCGISTCQTLGDSSTGNIGVPLNCNMIKLVDVPDMQYFSKDNVGELCIKGANVFKGYYRDEINTREALDSDGWLHTGDIAKWAPVGKIFKKELFNVSGFFLDGSNSDY